MIERNLEAEAQLYAAKFAALDGYASRAWQRFNWMITLELGWAGILISKGNMVSSVPILDYLLPLPGLIISIVWFFLGYEDDISIQKYGRNLNQLENFIFDQLREHGYSDPASNSKWKFRQTCWLYLLPCVLMFSWLVIFILLFAHH